MATHFSVLAWRIPGTGEPGGLPFLGLHRVGHDCSDLAANLYLKLMKLKFQDAKQVTANFALRLVIDESCLTPKLSLL